MHELALAISGDSAHTPPAHILENLSEELARQAVPNVPHTIYQELWHICFWQLMTLDWISGTETPYPARATDPFPSAAQQAAEPWAQMCERFFRANGLAAVAAEDVSRLDVEVVCPSVPGNPPRTMTVREQLESLAAHNAYHFGRIVLLRQLLGSWPPPSGGFTW